MKSVMFMMESVRFIAYGYLFDDDLDVEWLEDLSVLPERHAFITAAGYEPEDPTVRLGVLQSSWGDHAIGCLVVSHGPLTTSKRFAVSTEPIRYGPE